MQILGLTGCHQYHATIKNESVSCSLFCFVFLGQEKKNLFHSIHSNSTFNIKITFLYVDTQQIRKMKLTSCAFDYYLANKISKCGEEKKKCFKVLNLKLKVPSMKLSSWVRFDSSLSLLSHSVLHYWKIKWDSM